MEQLPYPVDKLVWTYEAKPDSADDAGKNIVRVYAAPEEDWQNVLSELKQSEVLADYFLPVFMSDVEDCSLPTICGGFEFVSSEGLHSFVAVDTTASGSSRACSIELGKFSQTIDVDVFAPALLCAEYVVKNRGKLRNRRMGLPEEVKIHKNAASIRCFIFCFFVAVAVLGAFSVRVYRGNSLRMNILSNELQRVESRLEAIGSKISADRAFNTKNFAVTSAYYGEGDIMKHLTALTDLLPADMRLKNFALRNHELDLTIVTRKYSDASLVRLQQSSLYTVKGVRKQTFRDSVTLNLKLEIVL